MQLSIQLYSLILSPYHKFMTNFNSIFDLVWKNIQPKITLHNIWTRKNKKKKQNESANYKAKKILFL